jgi:cation:H+ antiporter
MIKDVFILLIGFIALIKGADIFVKGSSDAAKNLKVPSVIIGLTIVALGTSAPELAVSVSAALSGSNEISVSNVVGSNIFNLLVVLGVCAMIKPLTVENIFVKRDLPISIGAAIVVLILCMDYRKFSFTESYFIDGSAIAGNISRIIGFFILLLFLLYIYLLILEAKKNPIVLDVLDFLPLWKCILLIIIGLTMIIIGGQAVVYSAKEIARMAGMTETLIGLTIVAVGTSLPELVTSIVATKKGETGLAIGNVVGSNIFNMLFILGVSAAVHPISVNVASVVDLAVLIVVSLLTLIFSRTSHRINRIEGCSLVLIYLVYIVYAICR